MFGAKSQFLYILMFIKGIQRNLILLARNWEPVISAKFRAILTETSQLYLRILEILRVRIWLSLASVELGLSRALILFNPRTNLTNYRLIDFLIDLSINK